MRAGIKQVKNRLSYYLRRVKQGESVEVTDRGQVVAELRPPRKKKQKKLTEAQALAKLAAEGLITLGTGRRSDFEPLKPLKPVSLSRLVIEDRG